MRSRRALLPLLLFGAIAGSSMFAPDLIFAQEEAAEAVAEVVEEAAPAFDGQEMAFDNFVLFICAVLVLFMQAGFAMVEAGFNSQKNVVNILFKNLMDICVGVILYALIGFNLMYPGDNWIVPGIVGSPSAFLTGGAEFDEVPASVDDGLLYHAQADYLFQVAFAATAATIVSGAVAGRMQFKAYLVYSAILTAIIYPISGSWKWGGGWLQEMGFWDFAGSCVVHAVGGFAGLAGAIVLGPRLGRYTSEGKSTPLPGHSITIATLGVFILWIGWYGFNPGSQLTFGGAGNATAVARIAVNTTLSAAAGGFAAMILSWILFSKPDISMALNGVLAGLVGITANCDGVTNPSAVIIGLVSGVLVVFGIILLDKLKIDDPVGAWPVHGLCGAWGCIACAIFQHDGYWGVVDDSLPEAEQVAFGNWGAQITGTLSYCIYAFVCFFVLFMILKAVGILRVSAEEEEAGLDVSEHGMRAYAG